MCWLIAGRRSGPVKWALHVYVFDFVYALVFVFLFVFVFVFVLFIDVLGLIVWERSGYVKWTLHHPAPTHASSTNIKQCQTLSFSSISSSSLTLYVIDCCTKHDQS